jgi:hypothetical protein
MAEWDRLVLHCNNNLPVTVSEKLIDGTFEFCFCCIDSPSMEVINLPCLKASVHRHCILEALQSNNQCVYSLCCVASIAVTPYCNRPPPLPVKGTQPIAPTLRPYRRGGGVRLADWVSGRSVASVPNC